MRRLDVRVSRHAFSDLAEILFYIEQDSPRNADVVEQAFYEVVERLSELPTVGHIQQDVNDDSIRFVPF